MTSWLKRVPPLGSRCMRVSDQGSLRSAGREEEQPTLLPLLLVPVPKLLSQLQRKPKTSSAFVAGYWRGA